MIYILDMETNGLAPTKVWCIVLREMEKERFTVFVNDDHIDSLDSVSSSLPSDKFNVLRLSTFKSWIKNAKPKRIVGHNVISYDFHWIKQLLDVDIYEEVSEVRDTYVLSRLANPKREGGHSVEAWAKAFKLQKVEVGEEQWARFDPLMIERCVTDVKIQALLYDHLRTKSLRGFSLKCIEIEQDVQKCIAEQIRNGVFLDEEKVNALYTETKRRADLLQREIQNVFGPQAKLIKEYNPKEKKDGTWSSRTVGKGVDPNVIGGPFSYFCYEPFNLDSPQQRVARLLKVGWVPTEFTPTGAPKFSEESLENLPPDAPKEARMLAQYLMCRSRQRLAKQFLDLVDDKGFIHGYVNTIGAATHRMSSSAPNLQNIPQATTDKAGKPIRGLDGGWGWECREVFTVIPGSGNVLVDADASGIQLRGLAHYGGDLSYIALVSDPNVDIHKVHAEVLQCSRSVAKTFIYALLMGAGVRKLAWVLGSGDPKRGRELLELFYVRFGFLSEFKNRLETEVKRGYHIGLDGRLIRLDPQAPHKAMASALQSFETIVVKYAMTQYQKELRNKNIWYKHRLTVHDEFLAETHQTNGHVVGQSMVRAFENAGVELGSKCPLTGGYKIGTSWAQVH